MTVPLLGHVATAAIVTQAGPIVFPSTAIPAIPGYRIAFEIERTIEAREGGRTRVTIYNAGAAQRRLLASVAKRTWEVSPVPGALIDQRYPGIPPVIDVASGVGHLRMTAGYPGIQGEVGWGSIVRVDDRRSGATWQTRIDAQDGAVQRSNAVANKTFPPGTPVLVILAYLGGISGAVPGFVSPSLADVTLGAYTAAGRARDEIRDIIAGAGASYAPIPGEVTGNGGAYDYWIEDGILNVLDRGTPMPGPPLVVSEVPAPGAAPLLQRPEPLDGARYRVVVGLWPSVYLGQATQVIDSSGLLATYRVDGIKHVGDTEGASWRTEITLSTLL